MLAWTVTVLFNGAASLLTYLYIFNASDAFRLSVIGAKQIFKHLALASIDLG